MDPIEKKFQEAFADYQYPVDDGLWDQVLEKKNRRKPFPWMRLAAAVTFLVLAGILLWPEQSTQPIDVVQTPIQTLPKSSPEIYPDEQILNTEAESVHSSPVVSREHKNEEYTRSIGLQTASTSRATELAKSNIPNRNTEIADLPQLNSRPVHYVSRSSAAVALPLQDIQWSPIMTSQETDVAEVLMTEKGKTDQSDITGPERLVHVLEKNSPQFVKDIIAFGSARNTEIEINW